MNKKVILDDICYVFDGPHATPHKTETGPIYLGIKAISENGVLLTSEYTHLSVADYRKWTKRVTPQKDDIVFSYEATLGRYAIIPEGFYGCLGRRLAILRAKNNQINIKWLYYYFKSPEWKNFIENNIINGSTVNRISIDDFPTYPIFMPEKIYQDRIANILANIDRKISLNNDISAELEKVARTLYDYWFVQFDFPNAESKPYRASGGEMVYNEALKRDIPKGWEVSSISDMASNCRGVSYDKEDLLPDSKEGVLVLRGNNIQNNRLIYDGNIAYIPDSFISAGQRIRKHDIIMTMSSGSKEHIGKCAMFQYDSPHTFGVFLSKLTPQKDKPFFVFQSISSNYCSMKIKSICNGTGINNITNQIFDEIVFPVPDSVSLKEYEKHLSIIYKKIGINELENEELIKIRDFLLPLLMNGQVTIASDVTDNLDAAISTPATINDAQTKRAAVFKRLVLSAYILDNICDEPTSGRVKFEKLLYLSEHCAQLPLHSEFHRAAAGPYDSQALYSIEGQLKKSNWFRRQKVKNESRAYIRMEKADGYKQYVDANIDAQQKKVIDSLLRLLKPLRTIQCEIIATLYGAWNDFLIEGTHPTDEHVVVEVLTNWNESKERISSERWIAALGWMREHNIVPTGYGTSTKAAS